MASISEIKNSSITSKQARNCVVCQAVYTQHCSSCNKVSYCSREHQKLDWKSHKNECFPAGISHNNVVGRHLVATRNIKQGEIILKENPLVIGPNCGNNYHPLCLSCFRIVKSNYCCAKCKWPLCGLQCEMMKVHASNECSIFAQQNVPPFNENETYMYEKIIILRALLCKESNPIVWRKLLDLESHCKERQQTIKGTLLTKTAIEFIRNACGLGEFSDEEIDHMVGSLATNAFWNNDNVSSTEIFRSGSYLFYYGSFPAHNCVPNSSWTIQMNSEFQLRASIDISCGDSITQLYTEATAGTLQRRKHLKETKYFECSCNRCMDPTELNTHFSSMKCPDCTDGYLVDTSPLNEDSDWKCQSLCNRVTASDVSICGKSKSHRYIDTIINDIRGEISSVNNRQNNSTNCIDVLRKLLTKYQTRILHQNHYLIYEIENLIIQRISYLLAMPATIKNKKITKQLLGLSQLMIELSRKSLEITSIILPGFTTSRGRLLYFLQQGLTMQLYFFLSKTPQSGKSGSYSPLNITEIDEIRKDARLILSHEPEGREEFLLPGMLSEPSEYLKFVQNKLQK